MAYKKIVLDFRRSVPIYKQLIEELTNQIMNRDLAVGEQMPSIRTLTEELNINPNTIAKAYREMVLSGLLETRRGMGYYVTDAAGCKTELSEEEQQETLESLFHSFICAADAQGISRKATAEFLQEKITEISQ